MLKIISGIIITVISTILGRKAVKSHSDRLSFYKSLCEFNCTLLKDLSFKRNGVAEAFEKDYFYDDFNDCLKVVKQNFFSGKEIKIDRRYLKDDERREIEVYFGEIGKYSSVTETDYLKQKGEEFAEIVKSSEEQTKKFLSIGPKLGFTLGIIVFILIL